MLIQCTLYNPLNLLTLRIKRRGLCEAFTPHVHIQKGRYIMSNLTATFHSSKRNTAISNAAKLSKVQSHNERGYMSYYYSADKIIDLVGHAADIKKDTQDYINDKFSTCIDEYNEKQRRSDRKIKESAFEYFCGNKNLDIANETLFQIGDKDFWMRHREETLVKNRKGEERALYSFSDEVKEVMNDIFLKQAAAYEHIYDTDKDKIMEKVKVALADATELIENTDPSKRSEYEKLIKIKDKDKRKEAFSKLPEDKKIEFTEFRDAFEAVAMIKKLKLIERIEADEMSIKLINLTGHYDEMSPHAHGISVCSAGGYSSGLSERVAKSVVLNKYALEVIQEKIHEIARDEMAKHPEIFQEARLLEKQKGRNMDYTKEEWARMKQQELQEDIVNLKEIITAGEKLKAQVIDELESIQEDVKNTEIPEIEKIPEDDLQIVQWCMEHIKGVARDIMNYCGRKYKEYLDSLKTSQKGKLDALDAKIEKGLSKVKETRSGEHVHVQSNKKSSSHDAEGR